MQGGLRAEGQISGHDEMGVLTLMPRKADLVQLQHAQVLASPLLATGRADSEKCNA
jgi:hypothetical protein